MAFGIRTARSSEPVRIPAVESWFLQELRNASGAWRRTLWSCQQRWEIIMSKPTQLSCFLSVTPHVRISVSPLSPDQNVAALGSCANFASKQNLGVRVTNTVPVKLQPCHCFGLVMHLQNPDRITLKRWC